MLKRKLATESIRKRSIKTDEPVLKQVPKRVFRWIRCRISGAKIENHRRRETNWTVSIQIERSDLFKRENIKRANESDADEMEIIKSGMRKAIRSRTEPD